MVHEYCWATKEAIIEINKLLRLPATGREQDWEIELADPSKIDEMLSVLDTGNLEFEARSALALLTIASIEEGKEAGDLKECQIDRIKIILQRDNMVCRRMRYYWVETGRANDPDWMRSIL